MKRHSLLSGVDGLTGKRNELAIPMQCHMRAKGTEVPHGFPQAMTMTTFLSLLAGLQNQDAHLCLGLTPSPPRFRHFCEPTPKSLSHTPVHMPTSRVRVGDLEKQARLGDTDAPWGVTPAGPGGGGTEHRKDLVSGAPLSSTAATISTAGGWAARLWAEGEWDWERTAGQRRERTSRAAWTMQSFSEQAFEIEQE